MLYYILTKLYYILTLVVMFIEYRMSTEWFPDYFKLGIPIYSKRLTGNASILSKIDDSHLNSASKSFVLSFVTPLIFKKIAEGQWAFHQQSFRSSIMHGKLFVEQEHSNVHLVSYINWWILLTVGAAILISLQKRNLFFLVFIAIMCLLYYFLEKKMYDRLVDYLSGEGRNEGPDKT